MRDIALALVVFGLLPVILFRPDIGILMWTWLGLMNPHRLAFGWAQTVPFAMIVGITTMVAIVFSREPKRLPMTAPVVLLIALNVWMLFTTVFALFPNDAWAYSWRVAKIQLFILLTILVMQARERIVALACVSALSIAFFGIKGGLYTLVKGGYGMVLGPDGGFISGNTEISLALTMTFPLMRWMQMQTSRKWLKWLLGICMLLVAIAVLGSWSRGGFIALLAMVFWFWLKGNRKALVAVLLLMLVPLVLAFMPDEWWTRMANIQVAYKEDTSALARLNSWGFALNLAHDKPWIGGGFMVFQRDAFAIWGPDPTKVWDSHSIWFSLLAEHGFVGLVLFVLLWVASWRVASSIIRDTLGRDELRWAHSLAAMIQVSFIGYWVGGSFLSLAYWDYPYVLVALLVCTRVAVDRELALVHAASVPVAQATPAVASAARLGSSATG